MSDQPNGASPQTRRQPPSYARIVARGAATILITLPMTLLLAGRIDYWQGWALNALNVLRLAVGAVVFRDNPDLVRERVRPGRGTKSWDKLFYAVYTPASLAVLVVGALDAGRFHWSRPPAILFFVIGLLTQVFAHAVVIWAMRVNTFFSSTVRIQSDRGQRVVQDGPYRIVRHPGNAAGILLALGMACMLGSRWALVPAGIVGLALVVRTALEDAALQRELEGYTAYIHKTRYRLLPGVW